MVRSFWARSDRTLLLFEIPVASQMASIALTLLETSLLESDPEDNNHSEYINDHRRIITELFFACSVVELSRRHAALESESEQVKILHLLSGECGL